MRTFIQARKAFTLVEVLLALALVAAVLAAGHRVLVGAIQRDGIVRAEAEAYSAISTLAEVLRTDLEGLYDPGRDESPLMLASGGPSGGRARLCFCTSTPALEAPDGVSPLVRWVSYEVVPTGGAQPAWSLLREQRGLADGQGPARRTELAAHMVRVVLQVHDGSGWRDEWPAEGGTGLPRAVRVQLVARSQGVTLLHVIDVCGAGDGRADG